MSIDLVGPAADVERLQGMRSTLINALGNRIKATSVVLKPAEDMPKRSDGGPSFGYWKQGLRQIWLWEETDDYPVGKTLAHEAMHVLDQDWLTRTQRLDLLKLMAPAPTAWGDQNIGGVVHRYVSLPSEVFAVYASAAICGFPKPAYRSLFKRQIPNGDWPKLAELALRDDGIADRVKEADDPVPSPPDSLADLQERLAATEAQLADANAAKQAAELSKAVAELKLATAKGKAAEISAL